MTHPVSVVIPTIPSRMEFLLEECLPSVWAAMPTDVHVVGGTSFNGNEKRNAGARCAIERYLLFVDDDSTISPNCLALMIDAIEISGADFAYAGYRYNVRIPKNRCSIPSGEIQPGKWNPERLRKENYIDTTSLIRRESFPGFDPAIRRFQDWDLWLTMVRNGCRGVYVPICLIEKFVIDEGIGLHVSEAEAREAIVRKHGL